MFSLLNPAVRASVSGITNPVVKQVRTSLSIPLLLGTYVVLLHIVSSAAISTDVQGSLS